jgi:membrane associated rhomboid family serine protease
MALKHEFNRQSGADETNVVLRIDTILTRLADRVAESVKARLHISRQVQTLFLYVSATLAGLLYVVLTRELYFLGIAVLAYMGSLPGRQRGSLVHEIQLEVTGLHRHTLKYLAVFVLAVGLFGILTSLPFIVLDLAGGAGIGIGDLAGMIGGLALIVLKFADYVARTNPTDKGDKEQPVERVRTRASVPMAV